MPLLFQKNLLFSRAAAGLGGLALVLSAPQAAAQDYMGMAELYGQGVVNSLGNQIRSSGIRSSMGRGGQGGTTTNRPATRWPAHIGVNSVGSHVFTVDELMAMNNADAARAAQMLNGRTIRVSGTVVHPPRADQSIHLVGSGGQGFHVFAFYPGGRGMPRAGTRVTLQGNVDRVRRTMLSLKNPTVSNAAPVARPSPSTGADRPDYQALRFRSSAAVTNELAGRYADALAPSLAQGRSKGEISALVRGGKLQSGFRQLLQPYGFSDNDIADVLASHMVMMWQVSNDHRAQPPRANILAVRSQTREALARAGWVQAMGDADKQRFAETLSVGTMMIVGRYVHGHETKDRATVNMAIRDAKDLSRSFSNIDMTRYALTSGGLAPRGR